MALNRIETDGIEDDAITTAKILDGTVGPADIGDGELTNTQISASAAIATSKISGLGTAATLNFGTGANQVLQLDGSGNLPAVNASALTNLDAGDLTPSGTLPALNASNLTNLTAANLTGALPIISGANLTGVTTDTSAMENNIAILAFKTQTANNLAKFNLVDQVVDEYKDATGVTLSTVSQGGGITAALGYLAALVPGDSTVNIGTEISSGFSYAGTGQVVDTPSGLINNNWGNNNSWTARTTEPTADSIVGAVAEFGSHATFYKASAFDFGGIMFWSGHPNAGGALGAKDIAIYTSTDTTNGIDGTWTIQTPITYTPSTHSTFQMRGQRTSQISDDHFIVSSIVQPSSRDATNSDLVAYEQVSVKGMRIDIRTAWRWNNAYVSEKPHMVEIEIYDDMGVSGEQVSATGNAISTANTALTSPTTGDIVMLIENAGSGAAVLGTNIKAFVSRNGGTNWYEATGSYALTDVGTWGSGTKKIITANGIPFAGPAGIDMRYKIEWAGQATGTMVTKVHATSLAWA
jgi:hypothetical protein